MKRFTVLTLALLLAVLLPQAGAASPEGQPIIDPCDQYDIRFIPPPTRNDTNQYVWGYEAETDMGADSAMSNASITIPSCLTVVACWPEPCEVGIDPHTGIDGIKWEADGGEFVEKGTVLSIGFITEGDFHNIGPVETGMKAGGLVCTYETTGPLCPPNDVDMLTMGAEGIDVEGSVIFTGGTLIVLFFVGLAVYLWKRDRDEEW